MSCCNLPFLLQRFPVFVNRKRFAAWRGLDVITMKSDQTVNYETTMVSAEENLQAVKKAAGHFCDTIYQLSEVNACIYKWIYFFPLIVTACRLSLQ